MSNLGNIWRQHRANQMIKPEPSNTRLRINPMIAGYQGRRRVTSLDIPAGVYGCAPGQCDRVTASNNSIEDRGGNDPNIR